MPYFLILLMVVLVVTGRFVFASDAKTRTKAMVALVCLASVAVPYAMPRWHLVSVLAQVLLVIILVFYSKFHGKRRE